jgi:hypothetical protein
MDIESGIVQGAKILAVGLRENNKEAAKILGESLEKSSSKIEDGLRNHGITATSKLCLIGGGLIAIFAIYVGYLVLKRNRNTVNYESIDYEDIDVLGNIE